jgi:hypothetical protein
VAQSWTEQAQAQDHQASSPTVSLNGVLSELLDDIRAKIKDGRRSKETLGFYEKKAGSLLAFLGTSSTSAAWRKTRRRRGTTSAGDAPRR